MENPRSRSVVAAMLGAAAVMAQFVSGKAVRDALFLTSLDLSALPAMLVATSVVSMMLVVANARATRQLRPATLVPLSPSPPAACCSCSNGSSDRARPRQASPLRSTSTFLPPGPCWHPVLADCEASDSIRIRRRNGLDISPRPARWAAW
jgi:hypothetical protein